MPEITYSLIIVEPFEIKVDLEFESQQAARDYLDILGTVLDYPVVADLYINVGTTVGNC